MFYFDGYQIIIDYFHSLFVLFIFFKAWPELVLISSAYHSTVIRDGLLLSIGRHLGREVAKSHGLGPLVDRILHELVARFRDLSLQRTELALLRAIILFNPGELSSQFFLQ